MTASYYIVHIGDSINPKIFDVLKTVCLTFQHWPLDKQYYLCAGTANVALTTDRSGSLIENSAAVMLNIDHMVYLWMNAKKIKYISHKSIKTKRKYSQEIALLLEPIIAGGFIVVPAKLRVRKLSKRFVNLDDVLSRSSLS